jgi:hypothetical protein
MAIEEEVIDDGSGDEESPSERRARLEQEQAERTAELEREREERHKAELEAATAKGELEALKRGVSQSAQPTAWTEEQWQTEATRQGTSVEALKATVGIANAAAAAASKGALEEAAAARKEAAEAREESRRLKAGQSVSRVEEDFYRKNPALVGRRADVDDFLNLLPAEVKEDPKKYADALEKAKTYVRGKAREDLTTRRGGSGAGSASGPSGKPRAEDRSEHDDLDEQGRAPEVDVSDLDNDGAKALVQRIARTPGGEGLNTRHQKALRDIDDGEELLKRTARQDGRGVSIDESDEWARAGRGSHRDVREAGKRPLRE